MNPSLSFSNNVVPPPSSHISFNPVATNQPLLIPFTNPSSTTAQSSAVGLLPTPVGIAPLIPPSLIPSISAVPSSLIPSISSLSSSSISSLLGYQTSLYPSITSQDTFLQTNSETIPVKETVRERKEKRKRLLREKGIVKELDMDVVGEESWLLIFFFSL
jgi:hypothetical protein